MSAADAIHYIDTNVLIALLSGSSEPSTHQFAFVQSIEMGKTRALTSELTLAECLVRPIALQDADAISAYTAFLRDRPEFPVRAIDREILILAAQLRAVLKNGLADSIHVATAIQAGCAVFVTDDKGIRLPPDMAKCAWTGLRWPLSSG